MISKNRYYQFALPEYIVDVDMVSWYSGGVSVSSDVQNAGYVTHNQRSLKSNIYFIEWHEKKAGVPSTEMIYPSHNHKFS